MFLWLPQPQFLSIMGSGLDFHFLLLRHCWLLILETFLATLGNGTSNTFPPEDYSETLDNGTSIFFPYDADITIIDI